MSFVVTFSEPVCFGQTRKVTGNVCDKQTKERLVGAIIQVEGKAAATVTDIDGNYNIQATPGDRLTASFIGYESKKKSAKETTNFELWNDDDWLDEVLDKITDFVIDLLF